MRTLLPLLMAAMAFLGLTLPSYAAEVVQPPCGDTSGYDEVSLSSLPAQAADTVELIERGGPFPYPQDGTVFQNREGILPACATGYYHEYTVKTPGSPDRGARRIVTGTAGEHFYTDDHYASFSIVDLGGGQPACGDADVAQRPVGSLPAQVASTIALVERGGPFPFPDDGTVYQNREGVLPACATDYYHLYTVPTPGTSGKGDRRLVTGGDGEYYYTPDRYVTFVEVITD
ncbi:ribonuclease domain-containing protein [Actinophytocola oryzae]|uniref:ribonuclease domain-containing protein n=1 Tax=Actinophytocola oryzae TaxID=502181 RepID=UPI00312CA223